MLGDEYMKERRKELRSQLDIKLDYAETQDEADFDGVQKDLNKAR